MREKDPINLSTDENKHADLVRFTEQFQHKIGVLWYDAPDTDWSTMKKTDRFPSIEKTREIFSSIEHPLIDILGNDFEYIYEQNPSSIRENFRAAPAIVFCKRQWLPKKFFKLVLEPAMWANAFFTGDKGRLIQLIDVIKAYESNSTIAWQMPEIRYELLGCLDPAYGTSMYTDEEFTDLLEKMKFPLHK